MAVIPAHPAGAAAEQRGKADTLDEVKAAFKRRYAEVKGHGPRAV